MASRYVLLEFDNAEQADKLREQVDRATRAGKSYRVVGYFAKPQAPYCGCGKETETRNSPSTLKRGKKFGWWVCTECKRPAASISGLVNLMFPSDIIKPAAFAYGLNRLMFYFYTLSAPTHAVSKED